LLPVTLRLDSDQTFATESQNIAFLSQLNRMDWLAALQTARWGGSVFKRDSSSRKAITANRAGGELHENDFYRGWIMHSHGFSRIICWKRTSAFERHMLTDVERRFVVGNSEWSDNNKDDQTTAHGRLTTELQTNCRNYIRKFGYRGYH